MRIADMLTRPRPSVSFEFMAPRDDSEVEVLERTVATLAGHAPDWVSVTYRLRTGEKTLELVTRIKRHYHIEAMAHLTCANSADRTRQILNWMEREGIANVLALRGDTQTPGQPFVPADPQLIHGSDLVAFVRRNGYRFGIGAACSAEKHPESPDVDHEFRYMKLKVEAGADFLITQLFFDNARYVEFVDRARSWGITVPILPGIMPITNYEQIDRFTRQCGATIPPSLRAELELRKDDPDAIVDLGVAYMTLQVADLLARGAPGVHFYTLNRSPATRAVVSALMAARRAW